MNITPGIHLKYTAQLSSKWGPPLCTLSTKGRKRQSRIPTTRFILTCCVILPSTGPIMSGAPTLRISRCGEGFCTWWRSWTGRVGRCCRGRLSNTMETAFCVEALEEAIAKYGTPEIFNTDQGSQFTSLDFTEVLKDAGVRISMDGKGRWMDNVFIERLWRSLKYESVYLNAFRNRFRSKSWDRLVDRILQCASAPLDVRWRHAR